MLTIRVGARWLLMGSAVLLGIRFALLSGVESLWAYYALFLVIGLGLAGVGDITVGQAVAEWIERGRGLSLGIVYIGSNLGGLLLIPIAVYVSDTSSWRQALLVISAGAWFVLLPAAAFLVRRPDSVSDSGSASVADADARSESQSSAGTTQSRLRDARALDLDAKGALRTRSFWLLFASLLTFFFYFLGILEHLVLFLSDEGMPRKDAAYAYATAIGLGIWSKLGLGMLADRIPEKASLLLDYALLALSSLVLLALPHDSLLWLFVATYGISVAARDVVYPLIITRCFGLSHMAEIYGLLMLTLVIGGGLGPYFAASIHDQTGSYQFAFATFAVLNLASVVGLCFVRDERRASEPGGEHGLLR